MSFFKIFRTSKISKNTNTANTTLNPLFRTDAIKLLNNSAKNNFNRNLKLQQSNLNEITLKTAQKEIEFYNKKTKSFLNIFNKKNKNGVSIVLTYGEFEEQVYKDRESIDFARENQLIAHKILLNWNEIPIIDTSQKMDPKIILSVCPPMAHKSYPNAPATREWFSRRMFMLQFDTTDEFVEFNFSTLDTCLESTLPPVTYIALLNIAAAAPLRSLTNDFVPTNHVFSCVLKHAILPSSYVK